MNQRFSADIDVNMADNNTPFDQPNLATPDETYESGILSWIDQRVQEGEAVIKDDPAYEEIDRAIQYIMGDQLNKMRPQELANCPDNRLKSILNQTVAALTDIHPIFGFSTKNDHFKDMEAVLIGLSQAWWINNFCDLKLADVIKFAAGVGTGYCEIVWDPTAGGGAGDIALKPLDPRDVLPIRPVLSASVQDWEGLILRSAKNPEELKIRFPDKAGRIVPDNQPSIFARTWTRAKKAMSAVVSPSAVDQMNQKNGPGGRSVIGRQPTTDVFTVYMKDHRLSIDTNPRVMGDPRTTWSYTVYPVGYNQVPDGVDATGAPKYRKATIQDSKLYPRGRMIVSTKNCVLYDGPNPYWHGMFPVSKLCLDPWPWSLMGLGLVHDIMPMQDAVNSTINGILDHINKLLRPAVVADKKSVATSVWERLDTRMPGIKLKTNAALGKGVEFVSPEALPQYVFEFLEFLVKEMDNQAGTPGLQSLMSLQQMPGEDTIEKMQEAMSPALRLKGRLLEYFLREVGEMVKSNFFQFYTMPRRVAILGEPGIAFTDFDFDPGSLVPAMHPEDPGYTQLLDKSRPKAERAQWMHKQFTFTITPNSLLASSQMSRKMMYLQLRQMQLVDRWTLYDVLEVPNGGVPPGGAKDITDRMMAEQMLFMSQQIQAQGMMMAAQGGMPGGGGSPSGMGPGQPDSLQQSPQLLNKSDQNGVPRQTLSTSGSGGG
jgi:hypothetical protein